ncbi:MAG: AEC family transporter, partial [Pseudomonadota bacterium]
MLQMFLLGIVGFILVRKKVLLPEGVSGLSSFLIGVTFPALIFWQLVTKFNFNLYPDWWIFPLASLVVTAVGLVTGFLFSLSEKDTQLRREFVGLVGFQN